MDAFRSFAVATLAVLLTACSSLPPRDAAAIPASTAMAPDPGSPLVQAARASIVPEATPSGFKLLPLAASAFETRIELARQATRSIDMQTFVFNGDQAGANLLRGLRDAAARGVRVRLLVDDLHDESSEALLCGLAAVDRAEVRLVNPFLRLRGSPGAKLLSSLDELDRVNHRMHNKLFVVDGAFAVFGGRNMGDEYFMRARDGGNFVDLDVLAAGRVVDDLGASFDRYWNSANAWPIDRIVPPDATPAERAARFDAALARFAPPLPDLGVPPRLARFATAPDELRAGRVALEPARADVIADPVDKLDGTRVHDRAGTVRERIGAAMGAAKSDVFVVSPYFVPGDTGMAVTRANHERGVRLRLLTNSLAATDEPAVHAGYLAYRRDMLAAGVEIFELSPRLTRERARLGRFGTTAGVLHAKVIVIDRSLLFVGSMNLDGRSEHYNTEIGVLIESAMLAREFTDMMDFESSAYRVRLDAAGELEWVSLEDAGGETVLHDEPEVGWLRRLKSRLVGNLLPYDWL